jgi:hypothetical protein
MSNICSVAMSRACEQIQGATNGDVGNHQNKTLIIYERYNRLS